MPPFSLFLELRKPDKFLFHLFLLVRYYYFFFSFFHNNIFEFQPRSCLPDKHKVEPSLLGCGANGKSIFFSPFRKNIDSTSTCLVLFPRFRSPQPCLLACSVACWLAVRCSLCLFCCQLIPMGRISSYVQREQKSSFPVVTNNLSFGKLFITRSRYASSTTTY